MLIGSELIEVAMDGTVATEGFACDAVVVAETVETVE